jgi:predicted nucleic acid-binding protein
LSVFYLDTSALVKRYVREVGTDWVRALTDPRAGNTMVLAEIRMVEAAAAMTANYRASRGITLSERDTAVRLLVHHCASEYELVPINRMILDHALLLTQRHRLRGYDAVHLASALAANVALTAAGGPAIVLVAADRDLRETAAVEGLAIDNPEDHQRKT